jgi:hypothetical protein
LTLELRQYIVGQIVEGCRAHLAPMALKMALSWLSNDDVEALFVASPLGRAGGTLMPPVLDAMAMSLQQEL